jgi:hypothetical protein
MCRDGLVGGVRWTFILNHDSAELVVRAERVTLSSGFSDMRQNSDRLMNWKTLKR